MANRRLRRLRHKPQRTAKAKINKPDKSAVLARTHNSQVGSSTPCEATPTQTPCKPAMANKVHISQLGRHASREGTADAEKNGIMR